ncbi:MAG: GNAT family N-acetyltransferase [Reyranellaceae bacterium]
MDHAPDRQNGAQVLVRAAEPADLPAVAALDQRITAAAKPAYWQDMLRRYGDGPADRYFLVAETADGKLLGFVIGEIRAWEFGSPPAGWVFAINVDPDTRLGGVGTRLFDAVCARFRAAGVRSVRTMVDRRDHLILSFFRSQGMMAGPSLELEMEIGA